MNDVHFSAIVDGLGFYYLDPDGGVDALVVTSQWGKAPLGGLIMGAGGLSDRGLRSVAGSLQLAANVTYKKELPSVICVPVQTPFLSLKAVVLTPAYEHRCYYALWRFRGRSKWKSGGNEAKVRLRPAGGRAECWRDFVYAVTYMAMELLAPQNNGYRKIGLNHLWDAGDGAIEPAYDAILNYVAGANCLPLDICFISTRIPTERDFPNMYYGPLPHRAISRTPFQAHGFDGIECELTSPIR